VTTPRHDVKPYTSLGEIMKFISTLIKLSLLIVALFIAIGITNNKHMAQAASLTETATITHTVPQTKEELQKKNGYTWRYKTSTDKLSNKNINRAIVKSLTSLRLKFPYKGIQWMRLEIRKHPRWNTDVMLYVEKGQMIGDTIIVRFDDGKPLTYRVSKSADLSSDTFFIHKDYQKKFIQRLKKAKKIFVSVGFYHNGEIVSEFNTKGLKW